LRYKQDLGNAKVCGVIAYSATLADTWELACLDHVGGGPAQGHLTNPPVLHVLGVLTTISIMDSIGLVDLNALAKVGARPSAAITGTDQEDVAAR
jgi:hypothetical protein